MKFFGKDESTKVEKSNLFFRSIKIPINTAVLNNWENTEYKKMCREIIDSNEFKQINKSELIGEFNKIIYLLLKNKKFSCLKLVIKTKNIIMKRKG